MIRRKPRDLPGALNCVQVGRVIQHHLDGRLAPNTAELVGAHLDDCKRCGMRASEYRRIKEALSKAGQAPDSDAVDRLRVFATKIVAGEATSGP